MAINHLYLIQSGLTGWKDSNNATASLYNNNFGVGTNIPAEIIHVAASGSLAKARLEQSFYKTTDAKYQASLEFTDYRSAGMGSFGFLDLSTYDLTISNNAVLGGPLVNITLPGGLGHVAAFTSGGRMGLRTTNPLYTFHISEPGNSDLALIGTKTNSNEFVVKNEGLVGVGTNDPGYRLHNTGDTFSHQYLWEQKQEEDATLITIDYDGPNFRTVYLTGHQDTVHKFTTINGADTNREKEIKAVTIRIEQSGEASVSNPNGYRKLSFENDIRFLGLAPTGLLSGRVGVLAFNSFGPNSSDSIGVYREEGDDITGPAGPPGTPATGMTSEGFGNRIIGGEFSSNPWQRGVYFQNVTDGQYTADRFSMVKSGSLDFDVLRDDSAPSVTEVGFPIDKSLKIQPDSKLGYQSNSSPLDISNNDVYSIEQKVEGFNWRYLAQGDCYLSFFSKSDQTGSACVYLQNKDRSVSYVTDYLITRSGQWQEYLIPIEPSPATDRVHNIVAFGNASITTKETANPLQQSSLRFSPAGYLQTCFHNDFKFDTGDFTIEAMLKLDTLNHTGTIYSNNTINSTTSGNAFFWEGNPTTSSYKFGVVVSGHWLGSFDIPSAVTISPLNWYHVALTRTGGQDFNLYVSGVPSSTKLTSNLSFHNEEAPVRIGSSGNGGYFNGWMDEYRISTGVKYASTFAPPTFCVKEPDTVLLLHAEGPDGSTNIVDSAYDPITLDWDYESGIGAIVGWTLAAGQNYTIPTGEACETYYSPNKWITGQYFSYKSSFSNSLCSGDFSLSSVNLNKFLDSSYIDRPYQLELELCQRYYEKQNYNMGQPIGLGQAVGTRAATGIHINYQTTKRTDPKITAQGEFNLTNSAAVHKGVNYIDFYKVNNFSASAGAMVQSDELSAGNVTILSPSGATGAHIIIDSEL